MAPLPPLGRVLAMKRVADGELPFTFGAPHPTVAILVEDGRYRIRALVIDPTEAATSRAAAFARHQSWMPEHYYELGKPTGEIYVDAGSKRELLQAMAIMEWPESW